MLLTLCQTARQLASATLTVPDSAGILPLHQEYGAGWMGLGRVEGSTGLTLTLLTMTSTENV